MFDKTEFVTAVDPDAGKVLTLDWKEGSQAVLGQLGANGAFVDDSYAEDHDLRIGLADPGHRPVRPGARPDREGHLRARPRAALRSGT